MIYSEIAVLFIVMNIQDVNQELADYNFRSLMFTY